MEKKTNVMRILDRFGVQYEMHDYTDGNVIAGMDVARYLGQDPAAVFKTLVAVGKSGAHYVFVIPVCRELDLKKAARSVGEKSIEMIKSRELLPLTGYVHGGCSPIGMKKRFVTVFDQSAEGQAHVLFSGGMIGKQVELALSDLARVLPFTLCDLTVS